MTLFTTLALALSLQTALGVSAPAGAFEKIADIWKSYYVVPHALLNPDDLQAVGLASYLPDGHMVDMHQLGDPFTVSLLNDNGTVFLPRNTQLMLLFNSTKLNHHPLVMTELPVKTDEPMPEVQLFQAALPFGIPDYHYVVDYSLLVPKVQMTDHHYVSLAGLPLHSADVWMRTVGFSRNSIPLSSGMLTTHQPVLVFVFQCVSKLDNDNRAGGGAQTESAMTKDLHNMSQSYDQATKNISNSLRLTESEVARAILASSSSFFDQFAKLWVSTLGETALYNSVFCQVNRRVRELSYCLKLSESGAMVSVIGGDPSKRSHRPNTKVSQAKVKRDLDWMADIYPEDEQDLDLDLFGDDDDDLDIEVGDDVDGDGDDFTVIDDDGFDYLNLRDWRDAVFSYANNNIRRVLTFVDENLPEADDDCEVSLDSVRAFVRQSELPLSLPLSLPLPQPRQLLELGHYTVQQLRERVGGENEMDESHHKRGDCDEITWKKVFLYSLHGKKPNFCRAHKQ